MSEKPPSRSSPDEGTGQSALRKKLAELHGSFNKFKTDLERRELRIDTLRKSNEIRRNAAEQRKRAIRLKKKAAAAAEGGARRSLSPGNGGSPPPRKRTIKLFTRTDLEEIKRLLISKEDDLQTREAKVLIERIVTNRRRTKRDIEGEKKAVEGLRAILDCIAATKATAVDSGRGASVGSEAVSTVPGTQAS